MIQTKNYIITEHINCFIIRRIKDGWSTSLEISKKELKTIFNYWFSDLYYMMESDIDYLCDKFFKLKAFL
jgi:hypothetical protein